MLHFDVEYYDPAEENLFRASPVAGELASLVDHGLAIDDFELQALGMFSEQYDAEGWRTLSDLRERARGRIGEFHDYYSIAGGTLRARRPASGMKIAAIEWMGVAVSIASMNAAFGLHDADWQKIPKSNTKDLDFLAASTGNRHVVIESKGSVVVDTAKKPSSVSQHKASIKDKKQLQRPIRGAGDVLIGTVAAIPHPENQRAKVLLVDPPPPELDDEPFRFKILARLSYYRALLRLLGRPHILIALTNRLAALRASRDISALDRVPLTNADGKTFGEPPSLLLNRTHSADRRISMTTIAVGDQIVLLGLHLDLIPVLAKQDFAKIASWKLQYSRRRATVLVKADPETVRDLELPAETHLAWTPIECDLATLPSGLVLGTLPKQRLVDAIHPEG